MSDLAIRRALEAHLTAFRPGFAQMKENAGGDAPSASAYQQVELIPATPRNPEQGRFAQLSGLFSVVLAYPKGEGPRAATEHAEGLRGHFWRGLGLTQGGVRVTISGTADIRPGFADGSRWKVPISIPYHADVTA